MHASTRCLLVTAFVLLSHTTAGAQDESGEFGQLTEQIILDGIKVRDGYEVTPAVSDLRGIRFLEFGSRGELYASLPRAGQIMTLEDKDNDGHFEKRTEFLTNRESGGLHGMHFHNGWLWYTTSTSVWRARDTDNDGIADENVNVLDDLPGGTGHWWRPIFVTDDGFFTGVGDPGNVTDASEQDREKIFKYSLNGTNKNLWSRDRKSVV